MGVGAVAPASPLLPGAAVSLVEDLSTPAVRKNTPVMLVL